MDALTNQCQKNLFLVTCPKGTDWIGRIDFCVRRDTLATLSRLPRSVFQGQSSMTKECFVRLTCSAHYNWTNPSLLQRTRIYYELSNAPTDLQRCPVQVLMVKWWLSHRSPNRGKHGCGRNNISWHEFIKHDSNCFCHGTLRWNGVG